MKNLVLFIFAFWIRKVLFGMVICWITLSWLKTWNTDWFSLWINLAYNIIRKLYFFNFLKSVIEAINGTFVWFLFQSFWLRDFLLSQHSCWLRPRFQCFGWKIIFWIVLPALVSIFTFNFKWLLMFTFTWIGPLFCLDWKFFWIWNRR